MSIFLKNAKVIDDGRMSSSLKTIVIENGLIAEVADAVEAPTSAEQVVDLKGLAILPGMTIGHWHPDYPNIDLAKLNNVFLGQQKPPAYQAAIAAKHLSNALMSGFTSVAGAGCSGDIDVSLKLAIEEGVIDGPRILPAGHHVGTVGCDGDRAPWWLALRPTYQRGPIIVGAESFSSCIDDLRLVVREEIRKGVGVIKIFPTTGHGLEIEAGRREMTKEEMRAVVETAHDRGALVRAHVADKRGILEALEAGVDILDHGDGIDEECIDVMLKKGTFLVPSMLFLKTLLGLESAGLAASAMKPIRRDFDHMVRMLPIANKAGIKIVPGDDYGLGPIPHVPGIYAKDLQIHVDEVGIPPLEVLRWVTVNGSALMRRPRDLGRIKKGYIADMIAVPEDIDKRFGLLTDPKTNIRMIMLNGQFKKNTFTS